MAGKSRSVGARLLAVGAVFMLLGAIQMWWSGTNPFALGAITGGAAVALVGLYLLLRTGGPRRSPDPEH